MFCLRENLFIFWFYFSSSPIGEKLYFLTIFFLLFTCYFCLFFIFFKESFQIPSIKEGWKFANWKNFFICYKVDFHLIWQKNKKLFLWFSESTVCMYTRRDRKKKSSWTNQRDFITIVNQPELLFHAMKKNYRWQKTFFFFYLLLIERDDSHVQ